MDSLAIFGLDAKALIFCVLAVLGGAFLKGYTGFGASMFWVTSLSLVLPPVQVVPMVMIFEVVSSLVLLPGIWRDIPRNSILALFAGTLVATPVGILALSNLPADPVRIALAIVVFLSALLIRFGFQLKREPGWPAAFGVGCWRAC